MVAEAVASLQLELIVIWTLEKIINVKTDFQGGRFILHNIFYH